MNPFDGGHGQGEEAKLEYGSPEFRILKPGAYVLCAVTGVKIPLESLKYWSVARQEAYADAESALKRELEATS